MIDTIQAPLKLWAVTLTDGSHRVIQADMCHHPSGFSFTDEDEQPEVERLWFHRDCYGCVYSVPFREVHSVDIIEE